MLDCHGSVTIPIIVHYACTASMPKAVVHHASLHVTPGSHAHSHVQQQHNDAPNPCLAQDVPSIITHYPINGPPSVLLLFQTKTLKPDDENDGRSSQQDPGVQRQVSTSSWQVLWGL